MNQPASQSTFERVAIRTALVASITLMMALLTHIVHAKRVNPPPVKACFLHHERSFCTSYTTIHLCPSDKVEKVPPGCFCESYGDGNAFVKCP